MLLSRSESPAYLRPYVMAAQRHGASFDALLWASPATQAARFDAICRLADLHGRSILDLGCGRGDLLDFLHQRAIVPADYIGLEAVEQLAGAAECKGYRHCTILRADFVREPARMFVGADLILCSGALNTLDAGAFHAAIHRAFDAAGEALVFNFLDSPILAASSYLTWHRRDDVIAFARTLTRDLRVLHDYLDGDCTIALYKSGHHRRERGA